MIEAARNWAGNVTYRADRIHYPSTVDEVQHIVRSETNIRGLGSRHSFSRIADSAALVDVSQLPSRFEIAADRSAVTVDAGMTYGRLVGLLAPESLAVHNLASLPHISIAGAIATGTHGSGLRLGNLATAVSGLELITGTGDLISLTREHPDFDGAVVSLGALGVLVAVTLDVEPSFQVEQRVYDDVRLDDLARNARTMFGAAYSVSAFTDWTDNAQQLWVKHRVGAQRIDISSEFGITAAVDNRHPIRGLSADACTPQLGVTGSWADRLPHFLLDFTPSVGEEIQSEFFVDIADAAAAVAAVRSVQPDIESALVVSELRTIAADHLWLSPHNGRDTLALHFTWVLDQELAERAARIVTEALIGLDPRPHWGKVFDPTLFDATGYPHLAEFLDLADRLDPERRFRNTWFDEVLIRSR
ncbi:MAG: FAD-binding protein [Acidimicrobiales bacterium]